MNFSNIAKAKLKNTFYNFKNFFFQDSILAFNKNLKNKHAGDRLFILGSGNSIKLYDLKQLKNEIVMTQNNFHVHPDIKQINPKYHCVVPYYQTKKELSAWKEWVSEMNKTLPTTQFFWGKNTKDFIDSHFSSLKERSFYFESKYKLLTLSDAKIDITKTIMEVNTVTTQCLTIALYMGFSEIYLLGFDHDQLCGNKATQNRFYGASKITDTDAERDQLTKQRGRNISQSYLNIWKTQKQLELLRFFAESNNIKIINASNEGILEVFDRRPLIDIVGNDMLKNTQ